MNQVRHEVKNEVDLNRIKEGEEFSKNFQLFPDLKDNEEKIVGTKKSKWAKYLSDSENNEED
jgi:hypothetical protein